MKIIFLGTSSNGGIPQLDCRCKNCNLAKRNPNLIRLRSSVAIPVGQKFLIIDCGPDFKQQLLRENIFLDDITGIALTHLHFDHIFGLPEFSVGKKLSVPVMLDKSLNKKLVTHSAFNFLFRQGFLKTPRLKKFGNLEVSFFPVNHSLNFQTFGVLLKEKNKFVCYVPDIALLDNGTLNILSRCNLIIFDGTFLDKDINGHLSIQRSVPLLNRLGRKVVFTHINHSEKREKVEEFLEKFSFKLAFDRQVISV